MKTFLKNYKLLTVKILFITSCLLLSSISAFQITSDIPSRYKFIYPEVIAKCLNKLFIININFTESTNSQNNSLKAENTIINTSLTPNKEPLSGKPFFSNLFILWIACLIIGLLSGSIISLLYNPFQKNMPLLKFEVPEEDEQEIDDIISLVETEITNKNFSISNVTSKLSLTPKRLSILTKRAFKRSFDKYILALRIEIVKERLRSSNASEIFITKSCGFSSVAEMEKKFQSLIGITPHKYREKNIFI
jgi:AraC-like DNA-binding protein